MEKTTFPTKTKIAAWWMIATGGTMMAIFLFVFILFILFISNSSGGAMWDMPTTMTLLPLLLGILLLGGISLFVLGLFLHVNKATKATLRSAVVILAGALLGLVILFFLQIKSGFSPFGPLGIPFIILLVPFVLLILDRKNFWKIPSKERIPE